jgi:predicted metal-dependent TIM-barrel fold hydrolase
LELIGKHDMVLATGHLSKKEIHALVKVAKKEMELKRVVVTHAEFPSQNMTAQEQVEVADLGATIEHCFTTMYTNKAPWEAYFDSVRKVGPERVVLSTDLGQTINPPVAEGFAMFAQKMLDAGFRAADVRRMCVTNPTALIS